MIQNKLGSYACIIAHQNPSSEVFRETQIVYNHRNSSLDIYLIITLRPYESVSNYVVKAEATVLLGVIPIIRSIDLHYRSIIPSRTPLQVRNCSQFTALLTKRLPRPHVIVSHGTLDGGFMQSNAN